MRVKEILRQKGMTSKELAEALGMTETGLSIAISDKGNPPLSRIKQLAEVLEVDISELFAPQDIIKITCPHCGRVIRVQIEDE